MFKRENPELYKDRLLLRRIRIVNNLIIVAFTLVLVTILVIRWEANLLSILNLVICLVLSLYPVYIVLRLVIVRKLFGAVDNKIHFGEYAFLVVTLGPLIGICVIESPMAFTIAVCSSVALASIGEIWVNSQFRILLAAYEQDLRA